MVRIITGTLVAVSQGKISEKSIPAIIESKDRSLAGPTAPPQGLYLNKVSYGGEIR
jgi:tRNA pseudouridine38-40 synthase